MEADRQQNTEFLGPGTTRDFVIWQAQSQTRQFILITYALLEFETGLLTGCSETPESTLGGSKCVSNATCDI